MDNTIKTWLYDILSSITEIESYYAETPKMFESMKTTQEPNEL
jgi:uncharacterized protein with HEPN domain